MSCRAELPVVLARWRRFRRALKAEDQPAMDVIIAALERNGPATFAGLDDPLEAAILAVLLELATEADGREALVLAGRDL
jgi:hypothetical protein